MRPSQSCTFVHRDAVALDFILWIVRARAMCVALVIGILCTNPDGLAPAMQQSDRHAVAVEFVILVVAAFTRAKIGKIVHEFDGSNPLDHFEA
jgi:hypothetical protein